MTDWYRFQARKKRVAAYFNDGHHSMSVECDKEHEANPDPKLVEAVQAAWKEFLRIYAPRPAMQSRVDPGDEAQSPQADQEKS